MTDFQEFPKIPRLNRDIVITEKIDGTNAQVLVQRIAEVPLFEDAPLTIVSREEGSYAVFAGSRNRWLTRQADNFGFAKWVEENAAKLVEVLGEGRHFGEWWGAGIQRTYGLKEKRFSLFNTNRWAWLNDPQAREARGIPASLVVVPVLYTGPWIMNAPINFGRFAPLAALGWLSENGSAAAPGFASPEGVVVYHTAGNLSFKATLKGDEGHKGEGK